MVRTARKLIDQIVAGRDLPMKVRSDSIEETISTDI